MTSAQGLQYLAAYGLAFIALAAVAAWWLTR